MLRAAWIGLGVLAGCLVVTTPHHAFPAASSGKEVSATQRGKRALLTKNYAPPSWPLQAYDNAWQLGGVKNKPPAADYARLFRERYGLHPAPYPNAGLPMGLRVAEMPLTRR